MTTNVLKIEPRGHSTPAQLQHGRYLLNGEQRWMISGPSDAVRVAAASLGPLIAERVENTLLITFGNTIGQIAVPGLGMIEVRSGKWGDEHFEQMLAELTRIATSLPFTIDQPSGFPYDRSVVGYPDIAYHLFVYLRFILSPQALRAERLQPALQAIVQQPHQRFDASRCEVPLAAAQRVDLTSLVGIAAGMGGFVRAEGLAARTPIVRVLQGHMPRTINERQTIHSTDTPENRFIKSFLELAGGIIEQMRRAIAHEHITPVFRERLLSDCVVMEQVLAPFAHHPLWNEVSRMSHVPASSTVLQSRRGYRDVYRHFVRLRLASRIPLDDRALADLLEARDIAHLYELWCYYTMVRLLTDLLGSPQHVDSPKITPLQVYVPHALAVTWPNGTRLRYNPRYAHGKGPGRSYSVPLRPDIALHVIGVTPQTHLFDAKFRLDRLASLLPAVDVEQPDADTDEIAEERRGTFKRGDLYKMHTYRDALQGTGSVWILYPGTESRFFSVAGGRIDLGQTMPHSFDGVGAIALRPEQDGDATARAVLARILGIS